MKKLVVLTGSGISAESGLRTFRDMGGLWEEYDVHEVASPHGWAKDMDLVLRFYNERRKQLQKVKPNAGHVVLAELEEFFDVDIITQNVDNLHERAGSSRVLHLHGELTKVRSTGNPARVYELDGWELNRGDTCDEGYQLRPHIVWFGESVPLIEDASRIASQADIFAVIGTSLAVYPAAGLVDYTPRDAPVYLVDPNDVPAPMGREVVIIKEPASTGVPILKQKLLDRF